MVSMVLDKRNMSEEQMIKGCLKNNPLAQRTLYNKLGPKMMGVCLRYMTNHGRSTRRVARWVCKGL